MQRALRSSLLLFGATVALAVPGMGQALPVASSGARSTAPWVAVFGGPDFDSFTHAVRAPNGGFHLVGNSYSAARVLERGWVARIEADGRARWELLLERDGGLLPRSACATARGGLVVVGQSRFGPSDGWIAKLSASGAVEWFKVYTGTGDQWFTAVARSPRGFFVGGFVEQAPFVHDACALEIDPWGEILWQRRFAGEAEEGVTALVPTQDGVLVGIASQSSLGPTPLASVPFSRPWLVRLDQNGEVLWQKTFTVTGGDLLHDLVVLEGGGFVAAGEVQASATFGGDAWVVRCDEMGHVLWNRALGDIGFFGTDSGARALPARDGGFVVAGSTSTTVGVGDDLWLQKVDAQGTLVWSRIYGGVGYDRGNGLARFRNGDFLLVGLVEFPPALADGFLTRLDPTGQAPGPCQLSTPVVPNQWVPTVQVAEPLVAPTALQLSAERVDVLVTPRQTGRYLCTTH